VREYRDAIDARLPKKRYLELEKEITTASLHEHDLIVADLQYRKLVIADEIERACRNEDVLSD
jgi:hypothetical protein